jgi:hypothetical protein
MNGMNSLLVWFWWGLSAAVVIWYCTITVYVAVKGAFDIRGMLRRLAGELDAPEIPNQRTSGE